MRTIYQNGASLSRVNVALRAGGAAPKLPEAFAVVPETILVMTNTISEASEVMLVLSEIVLVMPETMFEASKTMLVKPDIVAGARYPGVGVAIPCVAPRDLV